MESPREEIREMAQTVGAEHREIERLLERLDDLIRRHEIKTAGFPMTRMIVELCIGHIHKEEWLMEVLKYDSLREHATDHRRILETLTKYFSECEQFNDIEWTSFSRSLREAYYTHVAHFDDPFFDILLSM